jgi:hypothetical protein
MKKFFKKIQAWLVSEQILAPGISWPFFFKGMFMAFVTAGGTIIYQLFQSGITLINWHAVLQACLAAVGAYIIKSLFTDENNKLFNFKKIKDENVSQKILS